MGAAIPGLGGALGSAFSEAFKNVYLPIRSKAFPIQSQLLQQAQQAQYYTATGTASYPNQLYIPPKVERNLAKDTYTIKRTALDWLDEQVNRVCERGREWLSGQSEQWTIEIPAVEFVDAKSNYRALPPPVSNGLPVRLLPNGDYLWAPDVDPNTIYNNDTVKFENCTVNWSY